jgi:anti-sigma factor RsiW
MSDPERLSGAMAHPVDLLPEFVAGRLPLAVAAGVRAHLDSCPTCATELAAWRAVSDATRARATQFAPAADLADRVADRIAAEERIARAGRSWSPQTGLRARFGRQARWLAAFVAGQVPIVRREIWSASVLVFILGAAISMLDRGSVPGVALALFAPLAAALGIALVYGHDNDPSLELALATPVSPRQVVLARLTLVMAWDLALALAASGAVVVLNGRPDAFMTLVGLWLGPMLLLGCFSLVLSLLIGTSAALTVAGFIWLARAMELADAANPQRLGVVGQALSQVLDVVWQTSPLTLALAAVAVAAALALAPVRSGLDRVGAD